LHEEHDSSSFLKERFFQNPLIRSIKGVLGRVTHFKEKARSFYFEVILSQYQCPVCGGTLRMIGQSQCSCSCGNSFDPTLAFQKSTCCGVRLVKKTFHYVCSRCNESVSSRFLFDERVFDRKYFKDMMRESRRKAKEKREEIRRILAESRSFDLHLMDEPNLDSIPGLIQDLNDFIDGGDPENDFSPFEARSSFSMEDYRNHILSILGWDGISFSEIEPLIEESRQDRVWRFITLVFMDHDGEVEVTQQGYDLQVRKIYNEADT
jgi:hypothetical protein